MHWKVMLGHDINGTEEGMGALLISVQRELIFLLVAAIVLFLGFRRRIMLTH